MGIRVWLPKRRGKTAIQSKCKWELHPTNAEEEEEYLYTQASPCQASPRWCDVTCNVSIFDESVYDLWSVKVYLRSGFGAWLTLDLNQASWILLVLSVILSGYHEYFECFRVSSRRWRWEQAWSIRSRWATASSFSWPPFHRFYHGTYFAAETRSRLVVFLF